MKLPAKKIDVHAPFFQHNQNEVVPTWRYLEAIEKGIDAFFGDMLEKNTSYTTVTVKKVEFDCIGQAKGNDSFTVITHCEKLNKIDMVLNCEIYAYASNRVLVRGRVRVLTS